ncbi:MAG: helix-turn-helix domain-containing protein [Peptostreptococcaceae bacterium]|nr:helix-turn-helix domain-containing protein [Peptostreptococcaceae bacterium]
MRKHELPPNKLKFNLKRDVYNFKNPIKPNKEQEIMILKTIGSSRFIYNHFLKLWDKEYQKKARALVIQNVRRCCP